MRTSSNVLDANAYLGPWLNCEPIWQPTKDVRHLLGFAMSVQGRLELNDPFASIPCKSTRLNSFATSVPRTSVPIIRNSSGICNAPTFRKKRKKIVCTNVESVQDHSITKRIWNGIWLNTKKALLRMETRNNKKSSFAINAA